MTVIFLSPPNTQVTSLFCETSGCLALKAAAAADLACH